MDKGLDARPRTPTATTSDAPVDQARERNGKEALAAPSRLLSRASLEWLVDGGLFSPGPGSPLEHLRDSTHRLSARERQRAGIRLLDCDPWTHRPLLAQRLRFSPLGQALAVLESPEARLRIALARPGRQPAVRQYFLRGRLAVAAEIDAEGVRLAEPQRAAELMKAVVAELDSSALPTSMEAMAVLPEVFELLNALWGPSGRGVGEPITLEDLSDRLGASPEAVAQASSLLAAMVDAELLVRREEAYFLVEKLAAWLARVWSGHVVEMERQALSRSLDAADLESSTAAASELPAGSEQRLIFVGPPGERILCEDLVTGFRQSVLLLSRPGGWELGDRLGRLFSGVSSSVRSLFGAGDSELTQRLSWSAVLPVH